MQCLSNNAHLARTIDLSVQGLRSPLIRQIADQGHRAVSRKIRSRPSSTCRARYGDSEELRTQKKALEALLKTSKDTDGMQLLPSACASSIRSSAGFGGIFCAQAMSKLRRSSPSSPPSETCPCGEYSLPHYQGPKPSIMSMSHITLPCLGNSWMGPSHSVLGICTSLAAV